MREAASFIATQSVRRPFDFRTFLRRLGQPIVWFIRRREITALADLDDHLLADLGLERHDVRWALEMPLAENAALELERRAMRRRRGR
jgi:uncharacterized protein YjiS (DUF1127 family)